MEVYPGNGIKICLSIHLEARKGWERMRILSRLEYLDFNETSAGIQCVSMVMTVDHHDTNRIKKSSERKAIDHEGAYFNNESTEETDNN